MGIFVNDEKFTLPPKVFMITLCSHEYFENSPMVFLSALAFQNPCADQESTADEVKQAHGANAFAIRLKKNAVMVYFALTVCKTLCYRSSTHMANVTFSKNRSTFGRQLAFYCIMLCAGFSHAQESSGRRLADKEKTAREKSVMEAQELLMKGDNDYSAARYHDAVGNYLKARNMLPDAPAVKELRDAASERYATAALQEASALSRKGDVAGAKAVVDLVLAEDMLPSHPGALAMRTKLDDPIRTNPALTAEHTRDVDEVRRTLYEADGFFQLGKFDMARDMYQEVLRVDPTNKAARRGLERVAGQKSDYAKAAYDHTRGELLQQVDALWETPVPKVVDPLIEDPLANSTASKVRFVAEKMRSVVFPTVDLEQVGIVEAVDFIRTQAKLLDSTALNPGDKGFNIVLNLGDDNSEVGKRVRNVRFDLKVKNVPVSQLLQYICDQTHCLYLIDEYAINIRPLGSDSAELIGRSYKVPPDFLSAENIGAGGAAEVNDPFASAEPQEGLSAKRVTALEKLRSYGIGFPEGAAASFDSKSSTIFVRNTSANHDMIQQVVDAISQTEPVQVVVRVTIIRVQETRLKELGFDWLLNGVGLGGNGISQGSDALFLNGGTQGNGDAINDLSSFAANPAPITSGNRSGDTAIPRNSIDAQISDSTSGFSPAPSRAPGVISLLASNLNGAQVSAMMRGLDQKKGVDFVTKPATVSRSGQTSKIEMIREFIYPTEYEPPQLPNQVGGSTFVDITTGQVVGANSPVTPITPAMPTAFDKRDVGTVLEVNPIVSADRRYIELSLQPSVTSFDGFVNYGTPINGGSSSFFNFAGINTSSSSFGEITANRILQPIFSVIRTNTNVTIVDGGTIVLGGLVEERVVDVQDKVPVWGSIPVLGRLFESKARKPVRTNVLIMVSAELQDPSGKSFRSR